MKNIHIKNSSPVILLDTSYFIFYRYYSTLKWYQFRNKEIDYPNIHENQEFVNAFYKHVMDDFKKLCKTWKTSLSQMIFCCDCSRDKIWRNEFTNFYKQTRVVNPTFNGNIFVRFYEYIEKNMDQWGCHLVTLDQLEADDIVYLTKKKLLEQQFTNTIVVITNDNDYLQLLDSQTKLFNMNPKKNDLSIRSCGDPKKDLKIKLIMGDKVDNISAIHPCLGPKSADKLASLPDDEFEEYLVSKNCKENYLKNKKIIDFTEIPNSLQEAFNVNYMINVF